MAAGDEAPKPITLFYSYSHKDAALRAELGEHLVPLERAGLIEVWHDRDMLPGDNVDHEIAEKLRTVDLVLVLVSTSFIKSSYCYDIELRRAIERHERGEARVVPIILRPCQWKLTPLKSLVALPIDGRPVTEWPNHDSAFNNVAEEVCRLVTALRLRRDPHPGHLPEGDGAKEAAASPSPAPRERVGVRGKYGLTMGAPLSN